MTAFGGNQSYPRQLQSILNASSNKKFKVINKGFPGVNSDTIVSGHLKDWIEQYQSDMVVVMLGINDDLYYTSPFKQNTFKDRLFDFLKNIRIWKLARSIKQHLSAKFKEKELSQKATTSQNSKDNLQIIFEEMHQAPGNYHALYHKAVILEGIGRHEQAEKIYRKLIQMNASPHLTLIMYKRLGTSLRKQKKYNAFVDILDHIPHDAWGNANNWIKYLCHTQKGVGKFKNKLEFILKRKPNDFVLYDLLGACYKEFNEKEIAQNYFNKAKELKNSHFNMMTQKSYLKLLNMLEEKNIKGIFVQYPNRSILSLKRMFSPYQNLHHIIFVENIKGFEKTNLNESYNDYFTDRFAGDFGHCTPKGNKIIAQNIADAILGEKILE